MIRIFNQYVSAKSVLLVVVEALLIVCSLICAVKLRFWNSPTEAALYFAFPDFAVQSGVVAAVCLLCFYFNDVNDLNPGQAPMEWFLRTEQALGAAALLLGILYLLVPDLLLSRGVLILGMLIITTVLMLGRSAIEGAWRLTARVRRVVILGTGELALELAREVRRRSDLGMTVDGFISSNNAGPGLTELLGIPVLGKASEIEKIVKSREISSIVVAFEDLRGTLPTRELVTLRVGGVRVEDAPTALSALTGRISLPAVKPSWFVFSDGFRRSRSLDVLKRTVDLAAGIVGLVVFAPVMVLVAIAVRLDSRGPVLYRQTRVGHHGRHFEVVKFRSMHTDAESETGAQWAQENDPRVTRVGRILRKFRLDELPQFVNVIRGEMSFVGPRPERPCFVEELRKIIPYYDERHSVRPGVTGWAQVQYRYGSTVEDAAHKLEYDLFYLKNMSFTFDLAIIFQTVRTVLAGEGGR